MSDGAVFRGVGPAVVTPMDSAGNPDMDGFTRHLERMLGGGVDFLVPCGTTGESATLTAGEQKALIRRTVEVAAGAVPVLAGAGSNSTSVALELAQGAAEAGADGVLVVSPYYNKPSPAGLVIHYRTVARAGLPIVFYNVPGRTGANVLPDVVLEVTERSRDEGNPGVIGVKEASGSVDNTALLLRDRPGGFLVLSGDDDLAVEEAEMGNDGLISVVANEDPAGTVAMVHAALKGRSEEAAAHRTRLIELIHANFAESNPGPVKAALALMGHMDEYLRPPLAPVVPATRDRVAAALRAAGLLN